MIALVLVNWLLAGLFESLLQNGGPIYYDPDGARAARMWSRLDETLASLILLWPNLALTIKRVRDIGIPMRYFVGLQIGIVILVLIAPRPGILMALAAVLAVSFAPSGSADRFLSRRLDR